MGMTKSQRRGYKAFLARMNGRKAKGVKPFDLHNEAKTVVSREGLWASARRLLRMRYKPPVRVHVDPSSGHS